MTRHDLVDGAKASPIVGYLAAVFGGMTVNEWAAFAALVYSVLLILEKMGVLAPIKRFFSRQTQAVMARIRK